jgi:hypothetical protein
MKVWRAVKVPGLAVFFSISLRLDPESKVCRGYGLITLPVDAACRPAINTN